MKLSDRQQKVFDFVVEAHGDQKRKYTYEPYWTHLLSVATIVSDYPDVRFGIEIALCHDLFEDTETKHVDLFEALSLAGYTVIQSNFIINGAHELTDYYTLANFPEMNRAARKDCEAKRLIGISPNSQSVKYADIIDNTGSIVEHDPGFAKVYLKEIEKKIYAMNQGHSALYERCLSTFEKAVQQL